MAEPTLSPKTLKLYILRPPAVLPYRAIVIMYLTYAVAGNLSGRGGSGLFDQLVWVAIATSGGA